MTLACQRYNTHNEGPWLVWLHGLLGEGCEWEPVIQACHEYPSLVIDLPRHGNSASIGARNFVDASELLTETLKAQGINHYWLIGYSLGGRIAMYHACFGDTSGLMGLIVEGVIQVYMMQQKDKIGLLMINVGPSVFVMNLLVMY